MFERRGGEGEPVGIGVDCPDDEALAARLKQAIQNSKDKKYHGSSEHMNELPEMHEQAR